MLDVVLLLINLFRKGQKLADNRSPSPGSFAPLIPFLRRVEAIDSECSTEDCECNYPLME
jgi:hypothetical protein